MRVQVDKSRCVGHARCGTIAPEVYPLDDEGYCAVADLVVPVADEAAAVEGANACPEGAITIES